MDNYYMSIARQIKLNSKSCCRDLRRHHFKAFWFHLKGIGRAIKQLTLIYK